MLSLWLVRVGKSNRGKAVMMPIMDLCLLCIFLYDEFVEHMDTLRERWNAYQDEAGEGYYQLVYFD